MLSRLSKLSVNIQASRRRLGPLGESTTRLRGLAAMAVIFGTGRKVKRGFVAGRGEALSVDHPETVTHGPINDLLQCALCLNPANKSCSPLGFAVTP